MKLTEQNVDACLVSRGMIQLKVGCKFPTWIDKTKTEGIELEAGKLKSFYVISGMRNYEEPPSDSIKKTIELTLEAIDAGTPEHDAESIGVSEKSKIPEVVIPENRTNVILPDFLTDELMEKWKKLTTTQRALMFQRTPAHQIFEVEVGKKDGKAVYAKYVKGNYMIREANAAFLFDWYLADVKITISMTGVGVTGTLYAYFSELGKYLSRPATGYQELNKQVDVELAKKGATTDAIKKALSLFGFNSDVYGGERE